MNIQEYIYSGVLELYCMGLLTDAEKAAVETNMLLYPEIQNELNNIELALERYAVEKAITPKDYIKESIYGVLNNLEKELVMNPNDLPLINKFSNYHNWLHLVKDSIPTELPEGRFVEVLRHTPKVTQMLLVSSTDFEAELHDDLHESFLILEGRCECTVGDSVYCMEAGEYTEIPLHEMHSVKILTPYVAAILQRVAL